MSNLLTVSDMGAIIDVVALAILLLFTIRGAVKGFAKTFISIFGTVLSLLIAVLLAKTVANFLEERFSFITTVSEWASGLVTKLFGEGIADITLGEATEDALQNMNLTSWLITIILNLQGEGSAIPDDTTLNMVISPVLGYYIVIIISVIGLFILLKILFFLFGEIIKKLRKFALVGFLDRILGIAIGALHGIVMLQFALLIINVIPLEFCQTLALQIQQSSLLAFIDSVNVFGLIVQAVSNINFSEIVAGIIGS